MRNFLDFEKPIADLEAKIEELRHLTGSDTVNIAEEIARLEAKANRLLRQTYARLSAWQKVQVARHPQRPHGTDYIAALIGDFTPLAGDRHFGEDAAVLGGLGRFQGQSCVVLAQEKGQDMASRLKHNFGMPKPEGYRKAVRLLELAGRFSLPVITFVDTAGAFPGIEAEARGQAEAIARAIDACLAAPVPIVATVIGEGGSGGAIALATANRVNMLEHSIYSVISPEGCASILWRSADKAQEAAEALRITAQDLEKLGVIDHVIAEPLGGGHRDPATLIANVGKVIEAQLKPLMQLDAIGLKRQRREKYLNMGNKSL